MLSVFLICVVLGAFVGFLAGLLGIGGGLIIVPVLATLLVSYQVSPSEQAFLIAVATSLASIVVTSISSARTHHRNGNVPWGIAMWVIAGVAIGAGFSSFWADMLDENTLRVIFIGTIYFVAARMLLAKKSEVEEKQTVNGPLVSVCSAFIGGLASLIGIGGGALIVPLLTALHINMKRAIGCAAVAGGFISVAGSVGYVVSGLDSYSLEDYYLGYVYLPALFGIILATALTAPIGANATAKLPVSKLKKFFAIFLVIIASKMLYSLIWQ